MSLFLVVKKKPQGTQKKRLFIAVGKNVSRKAVTRNLIKRRIRTAMKDVLKEQKGDFLVVAKPGVAEKSFKDLKNEISDKTK